MMKKIITALLLTLSFAAHADTTHLSEVVNLDKTSVKVYNAKNGIERVELVTRCMTKAQANRRYAEVVRRLDNHPRYSRLNGSKYQFLFMEDGDIDKTILVARVKFLDGYRVIIAYDNMKED